MLSLNKRISINRRIKKVDINVINFNKYFQLIISVLQILRGI